MKTSISFLKSDYDFYETIDKINKSNADYIHLDIMDGLFVNNKTKFDKSMLDYLKSSKTKRDVHLMTLNLKNYIDVFSYVNPEFITFELEASTNPEEIIDYIKSKGINVGIAINPFTEVDAKLPFINTVDLILIMSVIPGYGGQKFITSTSKKIEKLYKFREEYKANFKISVDGGITDQTIKLLNKNYLDIVVSGSYVCQSADFNEKINRLR